MRVLKTETSATGAIAIVAAILFLAGPVNAQSALSVGSAETFDVATWNIEWFGSTGSGQGPFDVTQQRESVERVIRESNIDLWALQEISDTRQFQRLLDSLGTPWAGFLATTRVTQRIGYIYNTDIVNLVQSRHILESFATGPTTGLNYFAGRPPLQIKIDVMLAGTTVRLTVINLHMKCCSDRLSHARRTNASIELKKYLDSWALANEAVIVAGDFNDELSNSIRPGSPSPYDNFSADPSNFSFTTLPLDQNNIGTFCGTSYPCLGGSTIDHLLITNELFEHYQDGSAARLQSAISAIFNFVHTVSDHLPVFARFVFPTNIDIDSEVEIPARLSILQLFPNPGRDQITMSIGTRTAESVVIEIYDLLGRRQLAETIWQAGNAESRISIDIRALRAGVYFLRVSTGSSSTQTKFVRLAD